jgi:hypothetical protein
MDTLVISADGGVNPPATYCMQAQVKNFVLGAGTAAGKWNNGLDPVFDHL